MSYMDVGMCMCLSCVKHLRELEDQVRPQAEDLVGRAALLIAIDRYWSFLNPKMKLVSCFKLL